MKLELTNADEDIEVDMSPMIDMVFLLLIFFIVASTIIDEKVKVVIPEAAYAKVPNDTTGRLVISVTKDDQMYIGPIPVTSQELGEYLEIEIERDPNLQILIRAGKEVKFKMNEKIMAACGNAGASDLIFSAFEE